MQKIYSGICPEQGMEYSIAVEYIPFSDFKGTVYKKHLIECEYRKTHRCSQTKCPIAEKLEETIY